MRLVSRVMQAGTVPVLGSATTMRVVGGSCRSRRHVVDDPVVVARRVDVEQVEV